MRLRETSSNMGERTPWQTLGGADGIVLILSDEGAKFDGDCSQSPSSVMDALAFVTICRRSD